MKNKLLIISNNLFSYNNANGKFLRNYLASFSDSEICNFYISNDHESTESFEVFNVTDKIALDKLLLKRDPKEVKENPPTSNENISNHQTALKHLLRYFVWNFGAWKKCGFKKWIREQQPTHIVAIMGNNPYLLKISYKLAKKLNIPLITFICEDYPLKNYDFIEKKYKKSLSFSIFRRLLKKYTNKLIAKSNLIVFNTDEIKEAYSNTYNVRNSIVCYPPSQIAPKDIENYTPQNFLYAGNLGLGRIDALIEFANCLKNYDPTLKINVYSKVSDKDTLKIKATNNIVIHPFVSNEQLMTIINESGAILHIEYDSEYNKKDLKYAFSTKLADMICSGRRILLYAPKGMSESEYFSKYLPNNIATSKKELKDVLNYVLSENYDFTAQIDLAKKNHNINVTSSLIRKEIEKI